MSLSKLRIVLVSAFLSIATMPWTAAAATETTQAQDPEVEAGDSMTAEQIRDCSRANFPERTTRQEIELKAVDRIQGERLLQAVLYWKRFDANSSRTNITISAPADLAGSSYLIIEGDGEDQMFTYLPALDRSRRIAGSATSSKLWGTDFSYQDIKQLQGVAAGGELTRKPDTRLKDRLAYVLELRPDAEPVSPYTRILNWIDQKTCLPLKTEFYEQADEPRKRLLADPAEYEQIGQRWLATELIMQDLRDDTQTTLTVKSATLDESVKDIAFNPGSYYKLRP